MGGGAWVDRGRRREMYHHDGCVGMVWLDWIGYYWYLVLL